MGDEMVLSGDSLSLPNGLTHEWLLTNGLGGYAMGTAAGIATRGYHGWLVAAEDPPRRRRLRLAKMEIGVTTAAGRTALSSNLYPGAVHPDGADHLLSFSTDPVPTWRYRVGHAVAETSLRLVEGENACVMEFVWEGDEPVDVDLRPLINDRDHHGRTYRGDFSLRTETLPDGFRMEGGPGWPLVVTVEAGPTDSQGAPSPLAITVQPDPKPVWVEHMRYPEEGRRGYVELEDHASPGQILVHLGPEGRLRCVARVEDRRVGEGALGVRNVHATTQVGIGTRRGVKESADLGTPAAKVAEGPEPGPEATLTLRDQVGASTQELEMRLKRAAADFVVADRHGALHVIAGYPWFEEWARDTFVSVPGLFLCQGDLDGARRVLAAWAGIYRNFPGIAGFDGDGRPFGLAADAPLHYCLAVYRLWAYGGDVAALLPDLADLLGRYLRGFGPGLCVHVDEEGLVFAALENTALTWMDAVSASPRTPRDGYPVELTALFYKALRAAERMNAPQPGGAGPGTGPGTGLGPMAGFPGWAALADRTLTGFRQAFRGEDGMLYDRLDRDKNPDRSVRPNQLYAAGWPFPLLEPEECADLLEVLEPHLWTARGLRTLSPDDPSYRGRYEGTQERRDEAYHQGTVWPYLIGMWADAQHYAYPSGSGPQALRNCLEALRPAVEEGIIGQVAECYDGDPPLRPRGALAQAWSVAELLRALEEWVYGRAPAELTDPVGGRTLLPERHT